MVRPVALVSGGGRGIGRAVCLALAGTGHDIAVNYRRDEAAALETVGAIEAVGVRAVPVRASVGVWTECREMVDQVTSRLGPIEVLVHSGGIASRGNPVPATDCNEFESVVRTHLFGGFYLAKLCVPHMTQRERGHIIMISSRDTDICPANSSPYISAKAGLEALAFGLAKEVGPLGVHVNVVAPGLISTEMGDRLVRGVTDGRMQSATGLDEGAPFGHVGRAEEVAAVVRFLVSPEASYIHGERIRVDGGGSPLDR